MTRLLPVYRPSEASERHRGVQETSDRTSRVKTTRTWAQVNLNVASDRHMLLHGGNILGQAYHVRKLVAAATDDDGSGRSAKERKKNTSARAKAPSQGRLHASPLANRNRSSIAFSFFNSLPLLLLLLSPTNKPTVPDVKMCRSNLKRSKTKYCVICLAVKVPRARSRAWPWTWTAAHGI
jgi:hypothetical protein